MGYERKLTWKTPAQTLTLHKTSTGSLGILINTFSRETDAGLSPVTIVTRISPKCTIQDHRILDVNDRIVSIDGKPIPKTCICTNDVHAILKAHKKQYITLGLCRAVKSSDDNHKFKETDKNVQLNVQVNNTRPANFQRFSSLVSSDSGHGNSPTTGDLNGTFVFENNNNSEPVPCESDDKVRDRLTPALSDVRTPACHRQSDRQVIYSIPDENNIFGNSLDQFPPQCSVDLRDDPILRSLSRNSGGSLQSYVRRPLSQNSDDLRRVHRTSSQSSGDSLTVNVHGEKCLRSGSRNSCSDNGSETHRSVEFCSTCHSCFGAVSAVNHGSIAVGNGVAGTSHSDANCICNHQRVCGCIQADVCTPCVDPYPSERVHSMPLEGFCVPDFYEESPHHTRSLPLSPVASNHITNNCLCHQRVNQSGSFTDMAFVGMNNNKVVSTATRCTSKASCLDCLTIAQQILKYPQNVLWDPNTKVVIINRGNRKTPLGVSFTYPFCKTKDGTVVAYTLVEHVDKGGAAEGKLFVGDCILSVNGNPLHKASETSSVASTLELRETVTFVIQRSVNMNRAQGDHKVSPGTSCKHGNYSPSTDCSENFTTCHSSTITCNCDKSVVNNNRQTSDALRSYLPSHLHCHVCVPCPLGEECEVSGGRRPQIDFLKTELKFCGNSRVDNLNASTNLQDGIHQKEPGSKTHCHGNKDSNGGPPSPKEKKNFAWSTYVLNLPFDLLSALYLQLLIPMPVRGNDWHGFAGCIGMTANKVALYQLQKNPAQELITDWSRVNRSTLRDLIDILSSPDMERIDLVDLIKDKINIL